MEINLFVFATIPDFGLFFLSLSWFSCRCRVFDIYTWCQFHIRDIACVSNWLQRFCHVFVVIEISVYCLRRYSCRIYQRTIQMSLFVRYPWSSGICHRESFLICRYPGRCHHLVDVVKTELSFVSVTSQISIHNKCSGSRVVL